MQTMVPLYGFGGVPYSAVRKAAPRNLLDNSDFRNPVNQRGIASGASIAAYSYFIDRWVNQTSEARSYGLSASGITLPLSTTLLQKIEKVAEGTVLTFAIKLSDGTIALLTGTTHYTSDGTWTRFASVTHSFGDMYMETMNGVVNVVVYNTEVITIVWAAIYEGEYTAETLPDYQPKGYGAELAECQRYYLHGVGKHCPGLILSDGSIKVFVPTPVTMRTTPTATAILLDNAVYNNGADRVIALKSIASIELKPTGVYVVFNADLTAGQDMFHTLMTFGTTLHLSADL